jgi:hypothetical protein
MTKERSAFPRHTLPAFAARRVWLGAFLSLLLQGGIFAESIGRVGDLDVGLEELRDSVRSLEPGQLESVRNDPSLLEQLVRSLLVQRLVLEEAKGKHWHEEPAVITKLARVRDSTLTETYLESVSQPADDYPSEAEVKAVYEDRKESLQQPPSFKLAQIFIAPSADEKKQVEKIQSLLEAKDADFSSIAQSHSQEPVSAAHGGEIGWVTETQIQPELREQVRRLKLNETSPPIKLKDGWHFLKLLDARAAFTPTLEQIRPQLVKQLRQDKLSANTQAYLARLLKEHPLVLNESALSKVLPSP